MLLVGEYVNGLPEDGDHANKALFSQHQYGQKRAGATRFDQLHVD
jgi:hypothetical protein